MKFYLVVLFVLMCIGQWYVPLSMIAEQEDIRSSGKLFRFKTAPVDPSDPFRGKYITLDFEIETVKNSADRKWVSDQEVFVILKENADGYAAVADVTDVEPGGDIDYVKAEVRYVNEDEVRLRYPFDRFYLEESKASDAETVYAESGADRENSTGKIAYAMVRLKNGNAALEDVRINDRSIVDIVRDMKEAKE